MSQSFRIPATLSRYIARTYFVNLIFLLMILLGIIYLFDIVELVRRASKREDVPLCWFFNWVF